MEMAYKQRLVTAAKCVYDGESRAAAAEEARIDSSEYGIQAALKPHQVEGVSWLIRRYHLGVNVILGIVCLSYAYGEFNLVNTVIWKFTLLIDLGAVILRFPLPVNGCNWRFFLFAGDEVRL